MVTEKVTEINSFLISNFMKRTAVDSKVLYAYIISSIYNTHLKVSDNLFVCARTNDVFVNNTFVHTKDNVTVKSSSLRPL